MKTGEVNFLRQSPHHRRAADTAPWNENAAGHYLQAGIIASVLPSAPATVLEFGCWNGWLCELLRQMGYDVWGFDACWDAIAIGKRRFPQVKFREVNFERDLKLAPNADAVVWNNSLHHSEDRYASLTNSLDALRPGGVCVILEPGIGHAWSRHAREHARGYNVTERDCPPWDVVRTAKRIGFSSAKVAPHPVTLCAALYRPQGITGHPLLTRLAKLAGNTIGHLLITARHAHGMVVLTK